MLCSRGMCVIVSVAQITAYRHRTRVRIEEVGENGDGGGGRETESGGRMEIEGEGWEMHGEGIAILENEERHGREARETERPGEIYI